MSEIIIMLLVGGLILLFFIGLFLIQIIPDLIEIRRLQKEIEEIQDQINRLKEEKEEIERIAYGELDS